MPYNDSNVLLSDDFMFEPDELSLDPLAGGTTNGKQIWTPEQIAAYLNRTGGGWGTGPNELMPEGGDPTVITFGFHNDQASLFNNGYVYTLNGVQYYAFSEYFNFAPFTEAQRAATREAIAYWDDLVAVTFRETDSDHADINYANLASAPATQAYSRIPTAGYGTNFGGAYGTQMSIAGYAADVWVSKSQASNFQFFQNGYGLNTLVHETGHSLGLSHPGGYNFGPNFSATYVNGAEYAQDARNYSIMSYWNPRDLAPGVPTRDFNWSLMQIAYGSTPMVHDILAIQTMYGADPTTRTGDTVYGFNSNAGRDAFDFTKNAWPTMSIYDAGGIDTLDASGYGVNQYIDLTPGSLSSIGGMTLAEAASLTFEQVNANRAAVGLPPVARATYDANMAAFYSDPEWRGKLTDNVGIAYGTIVENAIGGSGNDTIVGNDADNRLVGNAGNDTMTGGLGNDMLIGGVGNDSLNGGAGTDTANYAGASSGVTVNLELGTATGGDGSDTLASIENVVGSAFNDRLTGDSGSNVLDGGAGSDTADYGSEIAGLTIDLVAGSATGAGGADTLISIENAISGAGNDRIIGNGSDNTIRAGSGYDVVTLGAGNDTYVADQGVKVATKAGSLSLDIVTDFTTGQDLIDLSGLGSGHFNFRNDAANRNVDDLTFKVYDSVNGAEKALGIDIHSHYTGDLSGPVTVVFADTDHKAGADMAIVLLNHNGVSASDFLMAA